MRSSKTPTAVGLVLLVVMAVFAVLRFETTTAITHFLVSEEDQQLGQISRALAGSELTRTMVISVEGRSTEVALAAASDLAASVESHPEVEWVRTGVPPGTEEAVYQLYEPRRFAFAATDADELAGSLSSEGMDAALARLKRELAGPLAPLIKRLAPRDPWLLFRDRMKAMETAQSGGMQVVGGRFLDGEGTRAIVLLATVHSAFDSGHQRPLETHLVDTFASLEATHGELIIERSAVHRFALQSEADIRADIQRISIISTVGIVVLFLLLYRSLRLLALALLPLVAGVVTATSVGLLVFGTLHGLTLAFGSTLIGICIDYPAHYFTHHVVEPDPNGPRGTLRRVWPGLAVGALTTVAGFAGLAGASFPGIREIGVFSAVGIAGAVSTTRYVLPGLMPSRVQAPGLAKRASRGLGDLLARMSGRRAALAVLPLLAVAAAAMGLPRMAWVDDAHALNRLQPMMLEEDERVRARVSRVDVARMVIATGADLEQALQRNDEVARRLSPAVGDGVLGIRSLHDFLWSAKAQEASLTAFRDPAVLPRMEAALQRAGFQVAAFGPLREALTAEAPPVLTYDDLLASPLGPAVRAFVLDVEGQPAVLTFVEGTPGPETLAAVDGLDGVVYFDQRQFLANNYRLYRERIQQLVLLGLLAVAVILLVRYRRPGLALAAFAPAILAAVTTLAVLSILGQELHLLHLVGVLLVLSMGVDYGVFLAETARQGGGEPATLLGLVIACLSTMLAFGLLALSANPAMRAVGLTTGIGVLVSLVLAPTTLVLTGSRPRGKGGAT